MVLVCIMCREPLLWAGPRGNPSAASSSLTQDQLALRAWESKARFNEMNGGGKYQPMATRCGHVFHKGCLKDCVALAPKAGLKVECPICLKALSYSHCFNVYLDAVTKDGQRASPFQKAEELDAENVKLQNQITERKAEVDNAYAELIEMQTQVRLTGEDLTAKEEETEMFKEYIKSVGGLQNIKHKLNSVNQRFQALGMQNTQLAALIEEHAKAQARMKEERNKSRKGGEGTGTETMDSSDEFPGHSKRTAPTPLPLNEKPKEVKKQVVLVRASQQRLNQSESEAGSIIKQAEAIIAKGQRSYQKLIQQRNSARRSMQTMHAKGDSCASMSNNNKGEGKSKGGAVLSNCIRAIQL